MILDYLGHCLPGECPSWVYGLLIMLGGKEHDLNSRAEWDYGLCMDMQMLCEHRGADLPFSFMPFFWDVLKQRRLACEAYAASAEDCL